MKYAHVYLIGLTGGIACGKSTVIAMLNELGAQTIDADAVTHRVQQPGTPVYAAIIAAFGPGVATQPCGPLDRRRLGEIVFSDRDALTRLEQIVHPAVRAEIWSWFEGLTNAAQDGDAIPIHNRQVAVIDAVKLLEAGWKQHCDAVWVVTCAEEQQVARLTSTRGMSEAEARQRIAAQPPQSWRAEQADVVIDNSGTLEQTRAQIMAAWRNIA